MLVGAVAIAVVVLGLAAVYTAQLTARPAATGSVSHQPSEAMELNQEVRRNARIITVRQNHRQSYYASRSALNESISDSVANYSELMAETYAGQRGVAVNASYDGPVRVGTRVVQYTDGPMTDGGTIVWKPVEAGADVGWFVFNFNVTEMDRGESFDIRVTNGTGADPPVTTYTFTRNETGTSVLSVAVDSETGIGTLGQGTCNPSGNRSLIDLTTGDSFTSDCSFGPGIDDLDGPYTVEFVDGDHAFGQFSIVTDTRETNRGGLNDLGPCPTSGPCNTYAAWNVTVTTQYQSGELSYTNTQNVTVYPGGDT
jgi:hypothetical protein